MGKNAKPKSPQTGTTIIVAIMIFLACAFASMILAAYHRTTIDSVLSMWQSLRPTRQATPLAPPLEHKAHRLATPLPLKTLLENSEIVFGKADFSLADKFAKGDFCNVVQPVFPEHPPRWQASMFDAGASDCIGQLDATPVQDGSIHNSLFVQIRRNGSGASTMVRIKLVYLPERMERTFKAEFADAAALVMNYLFLDDQAEIMADIKALRPFNTERRGINIKLFEEQLVPGAYNLMIEARCGKYECPTTSPFYKLSPAYRDPVADILKQGPEAGQR